MEQVVAVNRADRRVGVVDKMLAHQQGVLHRALSIFVFDGVGRLLLQRRAAGKYHSAGQWSNTCCTHPRPAEPVVTAAHRRLREEMGFDCRLRRIGSFVYRVALDNGLQEHELDHLFVGRFEGDPDPSPDEVMEWRWIGGDAVELELTESPKDFTPWFSLAWSRVKAGYGATHRFSPRWSTAPAS